VIPCKINILATMMVLLGHREAMFWQVKQGNSATVWQGYVTVGKENYS